MAIEVPKKACSGTTVGPPVIRECDHDVANRPFGQSFQLLRSDLNREITSRPDIRPLQGKEKVDIRGPATNPLRLHEGFSCGFVISLRDYRKIDPSRQEVLSQSSAIALFRPAEPDPLMRLLIERQKRLGCDRRQFGIKPAYDCTRRLRRDLLRSHYPDQPAKVGRMSANWRQSTDFIGGCNIAIPRRQRLHRRTQTFIRRRGLQSSGQLFVRVLRWP